MKRIAISLILFSFIQCNAMGKLMQLKEQQRKKEQRRLQNVVQEEEKQDERAKTIDECIELLLKAESTTGASVN